MLFYLQIAEFETLYNKTSKLYKRGGQKQTFAHPTILSSDDLSHEPIWGMGTSNTITLTFTSFFLDYSNMLIMMEQRNIKEENENIIGSVALHKVITLLVLKKCFSIQS